VVEWARLESECTLHGVPRVRIPPSPQQNYMIYNNMVITISSVNDSKALIFVFSSTVDSIGLPLIFIRLCIFR
jgi:hypothetical protein